jgi:hypothetical protein
MKKPIIWPWAVAMLLVACSHPLGVRGPQQAGSVRVALKGTVLSNSARTVVADASDADITSCTVELTSHDGYASQSQTVSWGSAANFAIVQAGTWDIFVAAFSASGQAAAGSATGQVVTAGSDLSVTVPLSMTQTGQGGFSLLVLFPISIGITYVQGTLLKPDGTTVVGLPLVPEISPASDGINDQATFAENSLASGAYILRMNFYIGSSSGALAGSYGEAVNVWDNVTSTKWVDSVTGDLQDYRTFKAGDFSSATFTVTYDGTDSGTVTPSGSVPVDDKSPYAIGAPVSVCTNSGNLVLPGYTLAGWTMSTGGAGPSYAADGSATFVMGSSNVVLHAVWILNSLLTTSSGTTVSINGYTIAPTGLLSVPTGATSIGANAFANCAVMTGLALPQTLGSIGQGAFSGCTALVNVTIPSSVGIMGQGAFNGCSSLTTVTMSATTPPSLGPQAFNGTASVLQIHVPNLAAYQAAAGWSDYASQMVSP